MRGTLLVVILLISTIFAQRNLNLGVAIKDWVQKDVMEQFVLQIPEGSLKTDNSNELVFIVTPFGGDADIFIKFDGTPTKESFDLRSTSNGADFIAYTSSSPFSTKLTAHIGVLSLKSDVTYSVLAYLSDKHVKLVEGIPQLATVRARESVFFEYTPEPGESGKILLSNVAITGDPDIFVSTTNRYPNNTDSEYREILQGSDLLIIPDTRNTTYYIAIHGYKNSTFAIGLTHFATQTRLIQNVPMRLHLDAANTAYFAYNLTTVTDRLIIQLDPNTRLGDPDLYVSRTTQRPSQSDAEFKSLRIGSDQVSIDNPTMGTYYIAVRAFAFATVYTLVARPARSSTFLINGQPQTAISFGGKYDYYKFFYNDEGRIDNKYVDFTATPDRGNVRLYLGSSVNQFPTSDSFSSQGVSIGSTQLLQIPDAADGVYYIGVLSEGDSEYTITASTRVQYIRVLEAQPYTYSIRRDHYRKFYFDAVNTTSNIVISVASQQDADLYVGVEDRVNKTHSIWQSAAGGGDVINIERNDPDFIKLTGPMRLYIAVYGYYDSYFTLTVSSDSITPLNDDEPVRGIVKQYQYTYYRYYMQNTGQLTFNLRTLQLQDDVDMYISTKDARPLKEEGKHEYHSQGYGSDELTISAVGGKTYYIGVYGFTSNSTYEFTVSTLYITVGTNGISKQEYVKAGQYRYYLSYASTSITTTVTLFSGSTLLLLNNNNQRPTLDSYMVKNDSWPGNQATIGHGSTSTYTYAVYGLEDSQYTIATTSSLIEPTRGIITLSEVRLAVFHNGITTVYRYQDTFSANTDYYLYVNLLSSPDATFSIYASQTERVPTREKNFWNETNTNQDAIIRLKSGDLTRNLPLYIALETPSASPVRVQVTLARLDTPVRLTQEQPNKFVVHQGESANYRVLSLQASSRLFVAVDSCDDNPADPFYMSNTEPKPTPEKQGVLTSTISPKTKYTQLMDVPSMTNSFYFIQTKPNTLDRSHWQSIYANTRTDQRPLCSDPVITKGDLVASNRMRLSFKKCTSSGSNNRLPITYHVYRRFIKRDDFENTNFNTVCSIKYHDQSSQIGNVDVPPDYSDSLFYDLDISHDTSYLVNIIARDAYGLETVYNQLGFNVDDPDRLVIGKSIQSTVNGTKYHQFTLMSPNLISGQSLIIGLTPLTGDVDMYVAKDQPPTKDSNPTWKAENGGYDVLVIPSNDPKYVREAIMYIGVLGANGESSSLFTITAYVQSSSTALQLLDGQPQIMTVLQDQYNQFEYEFNDNGTFSVTLSSISGDPDLYINSNTQLPDRYLYQWTSGFDTIDQVQIKPTDEHYKPYNKYKISVFGYRDSTYLISATKHTTNSILAEGVLQGGRLDENEFGYYQFTITDRYDLSITVLPIEGGGDPDLFISTTVKRPDYYSSTWRSQSVGLDTLVIHSNDPDFIIGTYYIAVHGYRSALSYRISAVTSANSLVLEDGTPQSTHLAVSGGYSYFKFFHGFELNAFSIKASGDHQQSIDMYVSTTGKPSSTKKEYTGVKMSGGIETVATIPTNAKRGWYYVGVTSPEVGNITVTVSNQQRATLLLNGMVNTDNQVANGYYKYFMFDVSTLDVSTSVTISINSRRGDPDLYISTNTSTPTNTNYIWSSASLDSDSVTISMTELYHGARTLFIGVHAFYSDVSFNIIAFNSNSTLVLKDAQGVPGSVNRNGVVQYQYEMTNRGRLKIDLMTVSSYPSNADLYVDTDPNPSPVKYKYKSTSYSSQDYVLIDSAPAGIYYIAVVSANHNMASYTLMASTQYAVVEMGSSAIDFVDQGSTRLYRTSVPDQGLPYMVITVTVISGTTSLYVKTNTEQDTPWEYTSETYPGNSIIIPNPPPGTYTIGVNVNKLYNADYLLTVHERDARITQGQPMNGLVSRIVPSTTFMYNVGDDAPNMYLSVRLYGKTGLADVNNNTRLNVLVTQNVTGVIRSWPIHTAVGGSFGQSVQLIDSITSEVPLMIQVYKPNGLLISEDGSSNDEDTVRFQVLASTQNDPLFMTQGFTNLFSSLNTEYIVLSSRHSTNMLIEFLSCDNNNFLGHVVVADKVRNSSNPAYLSSPSASPFRTFMDTDHQPLKAVPVEPGIPYYLQMRTVPGYDKPIPVTYSAYASTDGSWHKPPVRQSGSSFQVNHLYEHLDDRGNVYAQQYKVHAVIDSKELYRYDVYAIQLSGKQLEFSDDDLRMHVNYDTPCAVLKAAGSSLLCHYDGLSSSSCQITISAHHSYMVTVLATDVKMGTQEVYFPKSIRPRLITKTVVSPGGIILLIVGLLLAIYLFVGMGYNFIRNKHRGITILPHFYFWADLPSLIWDGVMFIVTCGKRGSGGYSDLYTIPSGSRSRGSSNAVNGDIDDLIDDNPFKMDQVEEARSNTGLVKGYGAI